jgi:hypothetical protein
MEPGGFEHGQVVIPVMPGKQKPTIRSRGWTAGAARGDSGSGMTRHAPCPFLGATRSTGRGRGRTASLSLCASDCPHRRKIGSRAMESRGREELPMASHLYEVAFPWTDRTGFLNSPMVLSSRSHWPRHSGPAQPRNGKNRTTAGGSDQREPAFYAMYGARDGRGSRVEPRNSHPVVRSRDVR